MGTTSSPHGLYAQGYTRATMGGTKGSEAARWSQSQKAALSSDRSLQLDSVKVESLVTVDQHATVNTFPGLVHTARHTTKVDYTRSRWANPVLTLVYEGWLTISICKYHEQIRLTGVSYSKVSAGRQASKVWSVIGVKS